LPSPKAAVGVSGRTIALEVPMAPYALVEDVAAFEQAIHLARAGAK